MKQGSSGSRQGGPWVQVGVGRAGGNPVQHWRTLAPPLPRSTDVISFPCVLDVALPSPVVEDQYPLTAKRKTRGCTVVSYQELPGNLPARNFLVTSSQEVLTVLRTRLSCVRPSSSGGAHC